MELSPQSVSNTTFKIVKKGYDPDEVRAYLTQLAGSIETTQNQAAAMEARARAAVVRLQEIAAQQPVAAATPAPAPAPAPAAITPSAEETETISRTLLLAQRTADAHVAEAKQQADTTTEAAHAEARTIVSGAQEMAARLVEEGRSEARRAAEGQRVQIESEVQSLLARREFLLSDVDHLEQHVVTQRERLRDVAGALTDIVERVPGGLADIRRPLTSAVGDDIAATPAPAPVTTSPVAAAPDVAPSDDGLDATEAMPRIDASWFDESAVAETGGAPTGAPGVSTGADDSHDTDPAGLDPVDLDPVWSTRSVEPTAPDDAMDATPPTGIANQFLFDDITSELPNVQPIPNDDLTVHGDQPA